MYTKLKITTSNAQFQKSRDEATSWTKTVESMLKSRIKELDEAMKDEA
jgi:hypothetical protein